MNKPTLLITAAGSLVGKVILDALEGRRQGLRIIGCDISPRAVNLLRCDEHEMVPVSGTPAWESAILSLVRRHEPFALIPGIDGDVRFLASLAERHPEIAAIFVGGSGFMADVISRKSRMAAFSLERGLPCAETLSTDHPQVAAMAREFVARHGLPLIAKPDDGSGSIGVRILTEPLHLERILKRPGLVIQPLLDSPGPFNLSTEDGLPIFWEVIEDRLHGLQIVLGQDGRVLGRCGFRSRMVRGRCEELWACDDSSLMTLGDAYAAAAAAAGWRGPFNIQAKRDAQGHFRVIELNGRFSGGTSSRLYLGFDELKLVLDEWMGSPIIPDACITPVRRVVRQLADYPVPEVELP